MVRHGLAPILVWLAASGLLAVSPAAAEEPRPRNLVADDPDSPSPYWLDNVRNCGPRCLHYLDRHFGGSRSLEEICALCPPLRDGSPLADVAQAARELGWGVTPFKARSWDLPRLEGPTHPGCDYTYFQRFEPAARIGYSTNIYHITRAEANRVRRERAGAGRELGLQWACAASMHGWRPPPSGGRHIDTVRSKSAWRRGEGRAGRRGVEAEPGWRRLRPGRLR